MRQNTHSAVKTSRAEQSMARFIRFPACSYPSNMPKRKWFLSATEHYNSANTALNYFHRHPSFSRDAISEPYAYTPDEYLQRRCYMWHIPPWSAAKAWAKTSVVPDILFSTLGYLNMLKWSRLLGAASLVKPGRNTWTHRTRAAHGVASSDFLELSGRPGSPVCESHYLSGSATMDLTKAYGYSLRAEPDPPLSMERVLGRFAAHHAKLAPAECRLAEGFLWVGPLLCREAPLYDFDEQANQSDSSLWNSHGIPGNVPWEDIHERPEFEESDVEDGSRTENLHSTMNTESATTRKSKVTRVSASAGAELDGPLVRSASTISSWALRPRRRREALYARRRYTGGQARYIRSEREMSVRRRAARKRARTVPRPVRRKKNDVAPEDWPQS